MINKIKLINIFFILILILGIFFRIINLDKKIYWVDEVATSLRIFGFIKNEVITQVSEKGLVGIEDLKKFQQPSKEKNFNQTLKALKTSPEHAPFYFILAKIWTMVFGSSVTGIRMLSVCFSLLSLACIFWLCCELFKSYFVGGVAICLMAVSPLYVAYAQEARPYSLWVVTILLSHVALLKAIRLNRPRNWLFYGLAIALCFYTSLLSILMVLSHIIYNLALENFSLKPKVINQVSALFIATLTFSPWLVIIVENLQVVEKNTTWMRASLNIFAMIAIWIYSIFPVFIETPIYLKLDPLIILRIFIDFNLFLLISFSFYFIWRTTPKQISLFIITQFFIPLLVLKTTDLVKGWQISTAIRYMMPSYLAIILSVAYLFSIKVFNCPSTAVSQITKKWKIIFCLLMFICLSSCFYLLDKSPQYQKTRNLHNTEIANIINQSNISVMVANTKDILDVISLGYIINKPIQVKFISDDNLSSFLDICEEAFLLNPSLSLENQIQKGKTKIHIELIYRPKLLTEEEIHLSVWRFQNLENHCLFLGL